MVHELRFRRDTTVTGFGGISGGYFLLFVTRTTRLYQLPRVITKWLYNPTRRISYTAHQRSKGGTMGMKIRNIAWAVSLLVTVAAVSGCEALGSGAEVPAAELEIVTATTGADGQAELTLDSGVTYTVQLATEGAAASLADMRVALAEIGSTLWLQVTDPAGQYFPATTVLPAPVAADEPIGVWLTTADDGITAREVAFAATPPAASQAGPMSPADFAAGLRDEIAPGSFATFVIALTAAGDLPETAQVYTLPFENTYLLAAAELSGGAGGEHVIVAASAEAIGAGGESLIEEIGSALDGLRTVAVPDWLLGSDAAQADTHLAWTTTGDYHFEGIVCDTGGVAIEEVLAYLDLRAHLATTSTPTDSSAVSVGQIVVTSPAEGDSWYADGAGEALTLWYCGSIANVVAEEATATPTATQAPEPTITPTRTTAAPARTAAPAQAAASAAASVPPTVTPSCTPPRIELWAAERAPAGAGHVWQLVYRASGATELRIFDNVMSNPVAGTFPIYSSTNANWVLTALSTPGCYVERNINVVVAQLPPAGTYSDAAHGFPALGTGDVQVTLYWTGEADLDLHVVDPAGEEIYSGHMFSASGGMLDGDVNWPCGPGPSPVENVFWPRGGAPSGEYRVLVNYYRDCKDQGPVTWTVMVRVNGAVVATRTGTITEGQTVQAVTFRK